ncbi:cytochrome C oxidase subunit IV family protein [Pseudogemmobacter bohemicus]|uniref:cytochrome C oxidase subunit IV family protein n=1 Tax=Pseudogemmobacter bohemicus TaxID=2250708 RepID=UPI0038CD35E8
MTRTWALLIALTAATTALAGVSGPLAVILVLLLAFLKARLILGRFLHLEAPPGWLAAFTLPVGFWLCLIGAGYVLTLR